jgi:hypothetical protein
MRRQPETAGAAFVCKPPAPQRATIQRDTLRLWKHVPPEVNRSIT